MEKGDIKAQRSEAFITKGKGTQRGSFPLPMWGSVFISQKIPTFAIPPFVRGFILKLHWTKNPRTSLPRGVPCVPVQFSPYHYDYIIMSSLNIYLSFYFNVVY